VNSLNYFFLPFCPLSHQLDKAAAKGQEKSGPSKTSSCPYPQASIEWDFLVDARDLVQGGKGSGLLKNR